MQTSTAIISSLLFACLRLGAEDIGHEFTDIRLAVPAVALGQTSAGAVEGKGVLPTLGALRRLLASPRIEPLVLVELRRGEDDLYAPLWAPDGGRMAVIRADLERKTSKIEILSDFDAGSCQTLFTDENSYDYMLAWARGPGRPWTDYCFASTAGPEQTMNLYLGDASARIRQVTDSPELKKHPDLFVRADGRHRLVFESEGKLFWGDLEGTGATFRPKLIGEGSFPEWSPGGDRVVYVRSEAGAGGTSYSLLARRIEDGATTTLIRPQPKPLRGPAWSPDGKWVACYTAAERKGGYDLSLISADGATPVPQFARDIIVESNFDNIGPAWSPDSRRLLFFSRQDQQGVKALDESYYRLLCKTAGSDEPLVAIDYDPRFTTAIAPAANPDRQYPEIAFAATRGLSQGIYVLVLNHLSEEEH